MLSASDTKIEEVLPFFTKKGIDVALIVPTETGMVKSIMDATTPVRQFLLRNSIHDYDKQEQGQDNKVSFPAFFVNANGLTESYASLYRPVTKKGDPRIWFGGLRNYCRPRNLLAIITSNDNIFVFNLSDFNIINAMHSNKGIVADVINKASTISNLASDDLLSKLQAIHRMGFVETVVRGDTGIGMTLESLLGIPPNSDKSPDYKGIEIKSSRMRPKNKNRVNLFTQVPNWEKSRIRTAQELLDKYGYVKDGRKQLYCTVAASKPNTHGLFFEVDEKKDILFNKSKPLEAGPILDVVLWELESLRSQLGQKHRETFWVEAEAKFDCGVEKFRYDFVVHTKRPNIHLFGALVDQGIITMDYTLSQKETRVRDHGYIFKIKPQNVGLLFPEPMLYHLGG